MTTALFLAVLVLIVAGGICAGVRAESARIDWLLAHADDDEVEL